MAYCSIIIPVHDHAALTRQCLDALLAEPPAVDHEIIVVDDASTGATPELLASYGRRLRVVRLPANRGFGEACNEGVVAASGEQLVFLNNDTVPKPGWLDVLVRYAEAHTALRAVGSKLLFPDDTIQHAGIAICQDRLPRHIYEGFPADHPAVNRSRRFRAVTGACLLVAREQFSRANGFDTAFVNGFEDIDLCLRLGDMGHEVHYCHDSVLYHLESASRDKEGRDEVERRNTELYRKRWSALVEPDDVRYYVEDGLLTVGYEASYPLSLWVSPLLAAVRSDERLADRLLDARARQVMELLKENIRLRVRLHEAELAQSLDRGADTSSRRPVPQAAATGNGSTAQGADRNVC